MAVSPAKTWIQFFTRYKNFTFRCVKRCCMVECIRFLGQLNLQLGEIIWLYRISQGDDEEHDLLSNYALPDKQSSAA